MKDTIQNIKNSLSPIYNPREIDAFIRIIFEHLMHYTTVDIIMHKDSELSDFIREKIANVTKELVLGKPIQYIFNEAYFDGHYFKVTKDTLIPRPETEELVEMIINENKSTDLNVLDIGTGSGCIAISLALGMKFANVTAFDISTKAISVAEENAKKLKAKINFIEKDILKASPKSGEFNIIVSNPPYICDCEKKDMEKNVLDFEPHTALFVPDQSPIIFYETIAQYARTSLKDNGRLYFEINNKYVDEVTTMLSDSGYINIVAHKDIHNLYRFVSATKPSEK